MAAVRTLPLEMDFIVYPGVTLRRDFRWWPNGTNASPQDFTGWQATLLIGQRATPAVLTATDTDGITLTNDGYIRIEISAAATATLRGLPASNMLYHLDLTDTTGRVIRFLRGRVSLMVDVEPQP